MDEGLIIKSQLIQVVTKVHFLLAANLHDDHAESKNVGLKTEISRVTITGFGLLQKLRREVNLKRGLFGLILWLMFGLCEGFQEHFVGVGLNQVLVDNFASEMVELGIK